MFFQFKFSVYYYTHFQKKYGPKKQIQHLGKLK